MPKPNEISFRPALLHDHLDGSRALLPSLREMYRLSEKSCPFSDDAAVKAAFADPHVNLVEKFGATTGAMQSDASLELAAYAYTSGRARQGFRYCEATIAPQYHADLAGFKSFEDLLAGDPWRAKGEIKRVVAALVRGIKRGEKEFPLIEVDLLLAFGREVSAETAVRLVNIFSQCDRDYAVGVSLVCDEAAHPPQKHIPAFRRAKELGFQTTAHAGEWVHLPPRGADPENDRKTLLENILSAIMDLGADRIGHAIPLAYSPDLMRIVQDQGIGIEGCPGSNLSCGLIPNMAYLKIRDFLDAHVMYSINPDDDLFMPDLDETVALCDTEYHFTAHERWKLEMNSWATRFGHRKHHDLSELLSRKTSSG
ncbi:MAG TPA: hypothetical protein VNG29_01410 [Candidatus Paceibacterota bacterium]|nr:hypothetical protein [Candidatus Paceibacterota bacterium]